MAFRWILMASDSRTPHLRIGAYPVQSSLSSFQTEYQAQRDAESIRNNYLSKHQPRLFIKVFQSET
jgi:hypothetical protein